MSQPNSKVNVGDVWWLPEEQAKYPGGKGRFCLIVALEAPPGARVAARAHYVVGSTSPGGRPRIILEVGEANLRRRTHFRFWWSGDIDLATFGQTGELKGRLDSARLEEIVVAIGDSRRAALKRLVR